LTPQRLTALIEQKILDSIVDEVSEAVYARDALDHMDICGTHRSDSHIGAS
jgi:hypothetical protein